MQDMFPGERLGALLLCSLRQAARRSDMYQVKEKPERLYLYVVRDDEPSPSLLPIALSFLSLLLVIAVGVLSPYRLPLVQQAIRVPVHLLPVQTFSAAEPVIPTGVETIPATAAS